MLRFSYYEYLGEDGTPLWIPHIRLKIQYGEHTMPVFPALVDTGATYTVVPSAMAALLGVKIDRSAFISVSTASGDSKIYRLSDPVTCILIDPETGERLEWEATVFFSDELETTLIGHKYCLEKFDVMFRGEKRVVEMEPLF